MFFKLTVFQPDGRNEGMCRTQSPLVLVDLTVWIFPWISVKLGLGFLTKAPAEGTSAADPRPTCGQFA